MSSGSATLRRHASGAPEKLTVSLWVATKPAVSPREEETDASGVRCVMLAATEHKSRFLGHGDIDVSFEFFPPQDRGDGGHAVALYPPARAAQSELRLRHLWRRRLDP